MKKRMHIIAACMSAVVLVGGVSVRTYAEGLNSGVTAALGNNISEGQTADVELSAAVGGQLSNGDKLNAGITAALGSGLTVQADAETQAAAGEPETICGYTNLGIADVENHLNVREGAGEELELVGKLPRNGGCEILGTEGEWYQIRSGKVTGYVKAEYLLTGEAAAQRAAEVETTIATTNTPTVYLRTEPNTDCTIWTAMPEGEDIIVLEDQGDWLKVDLDGDECYVYEEYVDLSQQLPKAMTMTEVRYGEGVSDVRVALVNYACQFVGNPYVWGGTSLTHGADCSGFTMRIFEQYGIYLPHKASAQAGCGTKVSSSEAKPGDLFFYSNGSGINHVAIYIGNGQVVHASSPSTGIKISNAFYRSPTCVVRLISD